MAGLGIRLRGDSVIISTLIAGTALMLMMLAFAKLYGTMFTVHESRMAAIAEQLDYPSMSLTAGNITSKGYAMARLKLAPMGYRISMVVIHYRGGKPPAVPHGCRLVGDSLVCKPVFNKTSGVYTVAFPLNEEEKVLIEAITPRGARYFYRLDKDPKHPHAPAKYWVSLGDILGSDAPPNNPRGGGGLTPTDEALICSVLKAYYGIECGRDVNPSSFAPVKVVVSWKTSDLTPKAWILGTDEWWLWRLHVVHRVMRGNVLYEGRLGKTKIWLEADLAIYGPDGRLIYHRHSSAVKEGYEKLKIWYKRKAIINMDVWNMYTIYYQLESPVRRVMEYTRTASSIMPNYADTGASTYTLTLQNTSITLYMNYTARAKEYAGRIAPYYHGPRVICESWGLIQLAIRLPGLLIPISISYEPHGINYVIVFNSTMGEYYVYPGAKWPLQRGSVEVAGLNGTHILVFDVIKGLCSRFNLPAEDDLRTSVAPPRWISMRGSMSILGVLVPVKPDEVKPLKKYVFLALGKASPPGIISARKVLAGMAPKGYPDESAAYVWALTLRPAAPGLPGMGAASPSTYGTR